MRIIALIGSILIIVLVVMVGGWWLIRHLAYSPTKEQLDRYFNDPSSRAAVISDMATPCPNAPFRLPSVGFVGFLYADPTAPYTLFNVHTGIDIFGDGNLGTV